MFDEKTITLKWTASTSKDLAGYSVYRGHFKGIWEPKPFKTVPKTTTSLKLTLPKSANYYFAVAAYDVSGNVSAKTDITP